MKVIGVILNYNDAGNTARLAAALEGYASMDSVVVVDNCSTDHSMAILSKLKSSRVHIIRSERNGGYGYGNNFGIKYAYEKLDATHVLVMNPDVIVTEECIQAMKHVFRGVDRCALISATVMNPEGKEQFSSWRLMGLMGDLLDTGLITRRLFKRWLNNPPKDWRGRTICRVDAVPGSLFMADCRALMDCGLYDEQVFLYYEEKILGFKLREKGYKTLLLLNHSYIHMHSVTIDREVKSILRKQALLHKSKLHYYKNYLKINPLQEIGVRVFLGILMAEIWFLTEVAGMSW